MPCCQRSALGWVWVWAAALLLGGTAWGQSYTVTPLTLGGTDSIAYAINDSGVATGYATTANFGIWAFRFKNGTMETLNGGVASFGYAINKSNQVAGYLTSDRFQTTPASWNAGGSANMLGFLTPGSGAYGYAYGLNDQGTVVGISSTADPVRGFTLHAFKWQNGVMTDLGTLGGTHSQAWGINNKGQIVGGALEANSPVIITPNGQFNAMKPTLWDQGTATCLCQGVESMEGGIAYAINEGGQIVGDCMEWDADGIEHRHAVVWQLGTPLSMTEIGTLGGEDSDAWGNNEAGEVVGWAQTAAGVRHAFFWKNGVMTDLNTLIPQGSGWELKVAYDINNNGQIVGYGSFNGQSTCGFLLTPSVTPNQPPAIVSAPWANPNPVTLPNITTVNVISSDPDNGPSALTYTWSTVSGPGTANFNPNGTTSSASSTASFSAAGTYTLSVTISDGVANVSGSVSVAVNGATLPPSITTQPANQSVVAGQTASFSVVAGSTAPLTYQWRKNGANIAGATSASYTTPATTSADNGALFSVLVSNAAGSVASSNAALTVTGSSSGPVAWWKLDETSGNLAADSSGNGNTGTLQGGATWTSGVLSGALNLDGSSGYVALPASASLNITSDISMAAWIKTSSTGIEVIVGGYGPSPCPGYGFIVNYPSVGQVSYWSGAYGNWVSSASTNYNDGAWHHVAVSVSVSTATFYKDGLADGSAATARPNAYAGARMLGNNTFYLFSGKLDDTRIYNRALSASEVAALAAAAPAAPAITSQPLSQTVSSGQTATFTVSASGSAPLSYQWRKNGSNISGATSASYTTAAATAADNGALFSVVVSNSAGNVTSNNATLTVLDTTPPTVDLSSMVLKGAVDGTGSAVASVTVNGQAAAVSGNTWSLEVPVVAGTNNFTIVVKDQGGNQTSKSISLSK